MRTDLVLSPGQFSQQKKQSKRYSLKYDVSTDDQAFDETCI